MTREDYIKVCSVCTNKSFNPKVGVTCGLTHEVANFEGTCSNFNEDAVAVKHETIASNYNRSQNKGLINRGRFALFVVAGLYVLVGFYEAFVILGADILYGIIDWTIAAVFLGLGIWSYKKAFLAMIIGLSFYCLIILLLALVDPITIIQGIIWKILVIVWLSYGISTARAEEAKQKKANSGIDDLLDQA